MWQVLMFLGNGSFIVIVQPQISAKQLECSCHYGLEFTKKVRDDRNAISMVTAMQCPCLKEISADSVHMQCGICYC